MEELLEKYTPILQMSPLFRGFDSAATDKALLFFRSYISEYGKNEYLHQIGDEFTHFGMVLEGSVTVCTDDLHGNRMIMNSVKAGETFGESHCFLHTHNAPVYIFASEPCRVLWLSADKTAEESNSPFETMMRNRFIALLASRTLTMNSRIQILSKLTLREKLLTYFSDLARRSGSSTFTIPLNREDMAVYLGTNRSALSRELSQMKKEGILDYYKNSFRILR